MNKEEQEVLAKNDADASYIYCIDIKEANISLHEDIICKLNNVHYIFIFARDIKGANKEKLFRKILELNNLDYINYFLMYIDFDKERYNELLMFL